MDCLDAQRAELHSLLPPPAPEVLAEAPRWVHYPWRRTLVATLGPRGFRAVRLDRNRNLVTASEQARLAQLRIGVVGLSAGHVIAHTIATQGLCGELRLADFDELELSNLNRVPATILDIGVNKAAAAGRRIAEIDPYLPVRLFDDGLTPDNIDEFLDGLDVVVDECDSLDMKAVVRQRARSRRIPVLMATSDRGLVDVERFDLEPQRPILHGLLGDIEPASLARMTSGEKVPLLLRFLEAQQLSARGAASLLEVDRTLSTWPQVCGDVAAGAPAIAESVRRIGLGENLPSGRTRIDTGAALDRLDQPALTDDRKAATHPEPSQPSWTGVVGAIATAAVRAPSASNAQPWRIDADRDAITVRLAPEHTSTLDVRYRASAVALGAAMFNIKVAAAAHEVLGEVTLDESDDAPLRCVLRLGHGVDPDLAALYDVMLAREANRRLGTAEPVDDATTRALHAVAAREGARLCLLTQAGDLTAAADIIAASDRARYLTPALHSEMIGELRWPGDTRPETGIDVRSLEFGSAETALVQILRRPEVMAHLARWDAGSALGEGSRRQIVNSSALAVITVPGDTLADYGRGGSAAEGVWITAQRCGLAVQPMSPIFLYARERGDLERVSAPFSAHLSELQDEFTRLVGVGPHDAVALVLRLAVCEPPSVRSLRDFGRANVR